jgi:hypothetical protein
VNTFIDTVRLLALCCLGVCESSRCDADPQVIASHNGSDLGSSAARIISIDTSQRTIVIDSQGTTYPFSLDSHLMNTRTQAPIDIGQLAPGQLISFRSLPQADGQLKIVSLIIISGKGGSGNGGGGRPDDAGGPGEPGTRTVVSPFQ